VSEILNEFPILELGAGGGLLTIFVFTALKLLSGREQDQGWGKLVDKERERADAESRRADDAEEQLRTAIQANVDLQNTLIDLERERMKDTQP
jgi:hypothetical protein